MKRQQRFQRLTVNASRHAEATKQLTAYTAKQAAKKATELTAKGYRVAVVAEPSGALKMTCVPRPRGERLNIASCDIDPTFKQQIKGLQGSGALGARGSKAAKACVSEEIAKHCRKKKGKCRKASARKQAAAISFSICRRKGFRSISKRP